MAGDDFTLQKINDELPYQYYEQTQSRKTHHFFINETVAEPKLYTEMVFRIQTAGPEDCVHIHLNTPGGQLTTGVQIINAMRYTQAHVVCSLEGEVASLGTMLFLAADEFVVHNDCMMMFHNYSGGVFGKGHEQVAALEATTKWVSEFMKDLYIPFMSELEFERLLKGEDLYFRADEIRKRLIKMVKQVQKDKKDAARSKDAVRSKDDVRSPKTIS